MHLLITAGPTREPIDPVRYLSNHSSGKMGYALAAAGVAAGHVVTLVSGPVSLAEPEGLARFVPVESAMEMQAAVHAALAGSDAVIMAAAVADFRPAAVSAQKLKRAGQTAMTLELVANPDILAGLRDPATPGTVLVGFAAETNNHLEHAKRKLAAKRCDLLIMNDVAAPGIGFGADDNEVTLLFANGQIKNLARASKREIAEGIISAVEKLVQAHGKFQII